MTEVIKSESLYDYFVEALEELTIPQTNNNDIISSNQSTSMKREDSKLNFLTAFFKVTNKMNALESSESFNNLEQASGQSSYIDDNNNKLTIQSFYKALEAMNIPELYFIDALEEISSSGDMATTTPRVLSKKESQLNFLHAFFKGKLSSHHIILLLTSSYIY